MGDTKVNSFYLIPKVRELRPSAGRLSTSAIRRIRFPSLSKDYTIAAKYLQEKFFEAAGVGLEINDGGFDGINIGIDTIDAGNINTDKNERYSLTVKPDGVWINVASPQGLFRAAATLIQLIHNGSQSIPCVDILDWPDFPVRGFYHDVTRGRVPTLDSLKRLADTLAFYKLNQLQLYVEHAFAFSMIPEFSEGKTPLAADDIIELDKYCIDQGIDLVPSLSTFGHLYELLRLPRFEHLNELDIRASETPRDLWDRMARYTLDVSNPESFELVNGMIEEYAPLFSSPRFNICCDETFDLGKGKNAQRAEREGVGRLYVEFVNKIIGVVKSVGKEPMLWGDIVLKHPEYISELPEDTVFLNWDYVPDVSDESVKKFKDAGVTQYVCPGVQAWSRFAADADRACANISRMARFGREAGAAGLLNTNWGDCAHINLPAVSYHGLAFGAAHSWNGEAETGGIDTDAVDTDTVDTDVINTGTVDFDRRFSLLQWGITDEKGRLGQLLRELGGLSSYHFGNLYAWVIDKQCLWYKEEEVKSADPKALLTKVARAAEIKKELETMASGVSNKEFDEYVWSAEATNWLLSLLIAKKKYEYKQEAESVPIEPLGLINDGKVLLERFKTLWLTSGRESELQDVVNTFEAVFERIKSF
jgi:hypothetical protein